ncbi:MAG: cysteine--tRNA ligase [Parcubacteria group bacterium]|nr:cysteine--tRNA ligase [Parcubacteria group bacterium]
MHLYNTLTGKKEELKTASEAVKLFVCGPTVYDYSHIGHARTYVFFDALVKFLRKRLGLKITYLQNITDIDDRIINRAREQGQAVEELAQLQQAAYIQDMDSLGIDSVDTYAPATNYIAEIISQVERLIKKGFAYPAESSSTTLGASSVYFDVRKFPDYGKLSHQKLAELKEGVRVETEPGKKYFADFAVWKASKDDEPSWPSPWGRGRPGWHIEDTAITEKNFGPRYHIHGGGLDLIFPHHEAEIAQMESLSGLSPLAQIWVHVGLLKIANEKMSKSLGNFITIRDFLKGHPPQVLRYFILSAQHRSELDYSEKNAAAAEAALERINDFTRRLKEIRDEAASFPVDDFVGRFWDELEDDFNTPQAWAVLFELIKEANKFIDNHKLSQRDAQKMLDFITRLNDIFGILPDQTQVVPAEVMALAAEREKARARGDFERADKLREEMEKQGWRINDTPGGTRIIKIPNS